jgi:hypothetical protein
MSRYAVSCELLVSAAHFDVVSLPSNPSSSRFSTLNRPADLVALELFALDFARLDHVLGERAKVSFAPQVEADAFHPAEQPPLFA